MKYLAAIFVLWTSLLLSLTAEAAVTFNVLGRSTVEPALLVLNDSEKAWLSTKTILRAGTAEPDYPPFDITNHSQEFEGISADYLALVGQLLGVKIEVLRYRNRLEVIQALKRGEIDLLASANDFEADDSALRLSVPYTLDQPTLVTRTTDSPLVDPTLAGKTIAMVDYYLPLSTVKAFYPDATFVLYPSILNAIGAVAFGEADLYLGDSITASYLINKSYLNNVQLIDFSRLEVNNFSFAVTRENQTLLRLVNAALEAIPSSEHMTISRRWNAGGVSISGSHQLQFSVEEQRWLEQHPRLKVVFHENFLPFTFLDEQGRFRGLSADVLAKISLRTGLKFEPQKGTSVDQMIAQVNSGQADVLAALTPSPDRERQVNFTRPYLFTPFVIVSRNRPGSPQTLDELSGKKLAIIRGNANRSMIEREFPDIRILEAESLVDAFSMVAKGEADATLSTLVNARYLIARLYPEALKITSTVGNQGAQFAFAINTDAPELLSILNKSLLSISPEEMDELTNRWRSAVVLDDSYWVKHRGAIFQGFLVAVLLLVSAFVWIALLRRQVLRREQAERALSDRLEFERVLINGTPHPTYVRDRQGCLLLCNKAYLNAFGVEASQQLLGTTVMQSLMAGEEQAREYHRDYLEVMAADEPMLKDRQMTLPSGEVLTIYHWILPYRGSDGIVKGLIGGWVDVSDRQRLVEQLHAAKVEADKANRAKTTFLATMSHEIRTPMSAVIGMLEMASRKAEKGEFDHLAIEVASDAAKGLLDLIGDILDIARIESGLLSLAPERGNPRELLMSVACIFDGLAREKAIGLNVEIDPSVDRDVLIDPIRFKQVIANLLSNAIKFTPAGEVTLRAHAATSSVDGCQGLQIEIQDSGIGINAADQQRLFAPFSQAGNSAQNSTPGSGLGLVISRTLVEMMEGTLELASEPAKGTLVRVRVELTLAEPVDLSPTRAVTPDLTTPTCPLNVLIVDDYPANRLVLSQQLTYLGHQVSEACDGAQALALWNEQPFDLVVTDCNMPGMDGYELARSIRRLEQERDEPGCLLLGFTANAIPEEKQRCLEAGMDDCLFKPISLEHLHARLLPLQADCFNEGDGAGFSQVTLEQHLTQLTLGDSAVKEQLRSVLASSTEQDLEQLTALIARQDRPGLAALAHRIKGGARVIQFERLIVTCENLEAACRDDTRALIEPAQAMAHCMQQLMSLLHEQAEHTPSR